MLPDSIDLISDEQKRLYISTLIIICGADGELVREEMAALESAMGQALIHPEGRADLRQSLVNIPKLNPILDRLEVTTARLALRDGFIIAACDGDYADEEISILQKIKEKAKLSDEVFQQLMEWVQEGWFWHSKGRTIIDANLLGDDKTHIDDN
ncbi:MAG: TerB family tellurite resistance protein [Euryarchaeota archaeon]|jgi:hypothetical protein|nr:TerB family tellurite resistance protein [Euryarchaeota archaeon]MBT3971520.1 TerB family tellurite resistance protein [Euryarchaeota archaeon]MBT4407751.1 TerB family tellurite resistance protein [Euryarchaeota archaeon]MBT6644783.1 TerB family tellurite resistance protein [Euryarchaeota archaeon]